MKECGEVTDNLRIVLITFGTYMQVNHQIKPVWHAYEDIPFHSMWADNKFWLPQVSLTNPNTCMKVIIILIPCVGAGRK